MIPALNEEAHLRSAVLSVIGAAKRSGDIPLDIIVVNDGSTDKTGEVADGLAKEFPVVRVLHHAVNQGVGRSYIEALALARGEKFIFLPGDNAVEQRLMCDLFLNASRADVVMGYILNTEYRPFFRHVLSSVYSLIYTISFGLHVKYINSASIFSVSSLRALNLRAQRYSISSEAHVKMLRSGATYYEVAGIMNPLVSKSSSALKLQNLFEVIAAYLRLMIDVHVASRSRYGMQPKRILPPEPH